MVVSIRRCMRRGGILRALYLTVLGAAVLLHLVLCSHAHSAHAHSGHAHSGQHHRHGLRAAFSGETCPGEARSTTAGSRTTAESLPAPATGSRTPSGFRTTDSRTAGFRSIGSRTTDSRTASGFHAITRPRAVSGAAAYCGGTPCPLRPLLPAGEDHTLCGAAAGPSITTLRVLLPVGRAACDTAVAEVAVEAPAVPAARRSSRPVRPLPGAALLLLKSVSRV
ncbi:hypothetical protein [Streptosporangium sandarakinum]|uniref:hypothetical protein n=1 Tax=Streptosporangium sandarakinum TaxID=1260955 RepID=UPI00343CA9DB